MSLQARLLRPIVLHYTHCMTVAEQGARTAYEVRKPEAIIMPLEGYL
jgi:hypothetical protein